MWMMVCVHVRRHMYATGPGRMRKYWTGTRPGMRGTSRVIASMRLKGELRTMYASISSEYAGKEHLKYEQGPEWVCTGNFSEWNGSGTEYREEESEGGGAAGKDNMVENVVEIVCMRTINA